MEGSKRLHYIKSVLENMPTDWLNLTTHQLDIYDEKLAKTQFLDQFEALYNSNNATLPALQKLPTAYDYIRIRTSIILCVRMDNSQFASVNI